MKTLEFVVFDANGKEIDWIDPVVFWVELKPGVIQVGNGFFVYDVEIPKGGRYEVRELNRA